MDVSKQLKKYQEALIASAIRDAFPSRKNEVHWNERFGEYFVDPDITFGPDKLAPEVIICVAHSDSEKESDKKFWRNAGELCLAKSRLPNRPLVANVVFEPHYKPALFTAMGRSFDCQVSLIADVSAPTLVETGPSLVTGPLRRLTDKEDIINYINSNLVNKEPCRSEFLRLVARLKALLSAGRLQNEGYWNSLTTSSPNKRTVDALVFESTGALRRGISKLLCVESADRPIVFAAAKSGSRATLPEFVFGLGWAQRSLKKSEGVVKDDDLKQLAQSFEWDVVEHTVANITPTVTQGLERVGCRPCREFGADVAAYTDYFVSNCTSFTDNKKLEELIRVGFDDPSQLCPGSTHNRWVLDFGLAAGKAIKDRAQGYGLSQLARELKCAEPDKVRFWIPDYNSGRRQLPASASRHIAQVLSQKFAALVKKSGSPEAAATAIAKWLGHTLVEVKLCTYRLFKPAEVLVAQLAISGGFAVVSTRMETCELFSHGTAGIGTEGLLLTRDKHKFFVKVQSGAKNTHDKAKELSGRIGLSLRQRSARFAKQFSCSVLVLDGPFKDSEAKMCFAAGWDHVLPLEGFDQKFLETLRQG